MKRARSFAEGQESGGGAGSISRSNGPSSLHNRHSHRQEQQATDTTSARHRAMQDRSEAGARREAMDASARPCPPSKKRTMGEKVQGEGGEEEEEEEGEEEDEGEEGRSRPLQRVKEEISAMQALVVHHRAGATTRSSTDRITLKEIAGGPIEAMAEALDSQPEEEQERLKSELREALIASAGGLSSKPEFAALQNIVLARRDIHRGILSSDPSSPPPSPASLRANRSQLQILVALKTGIQAFLHPDISISHAILSEVLLDKRCRNMACQSPLPADDCKCNDCSTRPGFCNVCMCTICGKFDFDANTCRWIGCDSCSHWAHTDCALRASQIAAGLPPSRASRGPSPPPPPPPRDRMLFFHCRACKHASELLGWAKDVFRSCAADWKPEQLAAEFDSVGRIFQNADDSRGRKLFWKSAELLQQLKNGADAASVHSEMLRFFRDLEGEDAEECKGENGKTEEPCERMAEVVQEAVARMEMVAQEKARALRRARAAVEACDREMEEKRKEQQELQLERQRKRQEVEELEMIAKLRAVEAEMFQEKADDARRAAEGLQRLVAEHSERAEEEYATRYLQLRLSEVEAERRALFQQIQLQQQARAASMPSDPLPFLHSLP